MLSAVSSHNPVESEHFGQHSFACCLQRQLGGHCSGACNVCGLDCPSYWVPGCLCIFIHGGRLLMHMLADMLLWPHLKVRVPMLCRLSF
jgi:hypothetical protein